jgi:hypothetical protein
VAAIGFWTADRIEKMRSLYADGYSCGAIGRDLGASRNAVVGKVHRMGLESPPGKKYDASKSLMKKARVPKQKTKTTTHTHILARIFKNGSIPQGLEIIRSKYEMRCVDVVPLNLTLAELNDKTQCHYIPGDDLLYCGHPIMPGSAYCLPHHHLVWVPPAPVKDKAPLREAA